MKITLFFILFSVSLYSQNLKDQFQYKATYKLTYRLDSTSVNNPKMEIMVLLIGENTSVFSSRSKAIGNQPVVFSNSGHTSKTAVTDFQYFIIKDYKKDVLYFTRQIKEDFFYYEQPKNQFNWKLTGETKIINEYNAQKATVKFSGRNYIVWFTSEIPIMDGPYKFNGLPGLIIELYDMQKHYHFELLGFEKLETNTAFKTNLKHYILTDRETFKETELRYRRDPFSYSKNPNITITPEVHKKYIESFAKLLEKENNPLELE
ncbi:GLPGLI family protein [Mangrovimonas sp. AS39]|uniref:GLPGLI family protein n=1 Tax=Mangrovimonas futianensis TaxID=2895523 RepID=UPI001E316581|nr:GLPGLI family protein [Mangrovimonas futianensis]MCF1192524.1 GLPGLI family protein [Mangrovimonas futianensis]MCF1196146.1 GLPGLI family protein [Mangrovimonas futianensis]